jgi:hypothetical protein
MTRDEILKLEAGREMDALIGEFIFGFSKPFPVYEPMKSKHGDYMVRPISEYSNDISAAWDVVEWLKDGYLDFDLYYQPARGGWLCAFGPHLDKSPTSKTPALAICRAALLAVQL